MRQQLTEETSFKDAGSELATPFGSLHLTSQGKSSPGTLKGKGRGANQETHGTMT